MRTDNGGGRTARQLDMDRILVVEDSQEDAEAIERALARSHPMLRLEFMDRGEEVAGRLLADSTPPGVVLLDLNMPGMSGHDVLAAVRAQPDLAAVRIVVFTTSTAPAEEDACHAAGADSYVYKPLNFDLFRTVLTGAIDYWLRSPG
ncbi:response regulator [Streptomyces sp. NPDC001904]|uniref:response regulator n=1 Tax=Streptomyces sp. NPDC001904 TaxID=3154531 RepID=UPI00332AEDC1